MRTFIKLEDDRYKDRDTGEEVGDSELIHLVKAEHDFRILNEEETDITEQELAAIFVRSLKRKSDVERFFDSVKGFFETGKTSAASFFQDFFYTGYGAFVTTEKKAREWIDQMVASGKISREKGEEWFKKAKDHFAEREKLIETKVREVVQKKLGDLGIATRAELEETIAQAVEKSTQKLRAELDELKKQIKDLAGKNS